MFSGPFIEVLQLQEWSRISYQEDNPGIYPFDKVPVIEFNFELFSGSSEIHLLKCFLSYPVIWFCHLPTSLNIYGFSFSPNVLITWFGRSTPSVMCRLQLFITRMVLFTNPSARAGYDTRSIFKRSLTGLNSEFSFS